MKLDMFFSEILRKTIIEQIAAILVLPNKIIIPLSEEIPMESLKIPEPEVSLTKVVDHTSYMIQAFTLFLS